MEIKYFDLSSLRRCDQEWSNMKKMEGGRLCASCNKCIIDFRKKSYHEIARIHAMSENGACGLYTDAQLRGEPLPPPSKKRWKPFLLALMPSFFYSVQYSYAEDTPIIKVEDSLYSKNDTIPGTEESSKISQPLSISGRVFDGIKGEPLISAVVFLKGTSMGTITDTSGYFQIEYLREEFEKDSIGIVINYVGFQNKEISLPKENVSDLYIEMSEAATMTNFVVAYYPPQKRAWRFITSPFRKLVGLFRR